MKEMLQTLIARIQENPLLLPVGLGGLLIALTWLTKKPRQTSNFAVREADRMAALAGQKLKGHSSAGATPDDLAHATMKRHAPLALPGISISGEAHEILGVRPDASAREIQVAYMDKVKRYHPDKVGRPGSREWQDAQQIAIALNRAREEMLQRAKRRG